MLFWAPLCLVVGAKKYLFGALYKHSGEGEVGERHDDDEEEEEAEEEAEEERASTSHATCQ